MTRPNPQSGASILAVVAVLGVVFALVQGTVMYRTKSSVRFQAAEKNKILAQQLAEAGVEENIADLGRRALRPTAGMSGYATYSGKPLGAGTFSSYLTTVGVGAESDTVDLHSIGRVAAASQGVRARLRIRRHMDTAYTPTAIPTTVTETLTDTLYDTTFSVVTVVQDPDEMPALDATPAYDACMSSSDRRCDVCHIPQGNPANRHVITINKNAIHTHISHHGDYVTTDGTCDIYNPRDDTLTNIAQRVEMRTVTRVVYTPGTEMDIDTITKVQVLSWR
jgi:hypothetical protein